MAERLTLRPPFSICRCTFTTLGDLFSGLERGSNLSSLDAAASKGDENESGNDLVQVVKDLFRLVESTCTPLHLTLTDHKLSGTVTSTTKARISYSHSAIVE